jgi:hypothetical protein
VTVRISYVSIAIEALPLTAGRPESCYVNVCLPSLELKISNEAGDALARMIGEDETLPTLLESAIDGAAVESDWAGLVLLRECLLKYADEAQSALSQIAKEGPAKLAHASEGSA